MYFGAANRDPAQFDRADQLDLARAQNEHIAFGNGPHVCLGQHIARIEIDAMLVEVLSRMEEVERITPPQSLARNPISSPSTRAKPETSASQDKLCINERSIRSARLGLAHRRSRYPPSRSVRQPHGLLPVPMGWARDAPAQEPASPGLRGFSRLLRPVVGGTMNPSEISCSKPQLKETPNTRQYLHYRGPVFVGQGRRHQLRCITP